MSYESSYTSGRKPFLPDTTRGYWAMPFDFVFAGVALSLRMDMPYNFALPIVELGIIIVVPYLLCLALYVVPIMIIQAFVGQFSSSGFIASFRMSPLFKGIGYIALAVDFSILSYYIIYATIPMMFIFNSFRATLPWSCEGMQSWSFNLTSEDQAHTCNIRETLSERNSTNETYYYYNVMATPSMIYINSYFGPDDYEEMSKRLPPTLSLEMLGCSLLTWSVIAFVLSKCFDAEKMSKVMRYGLCVVVAVLSLCCIRFMFLPGAQNALKLQQSDSSFAEILYGILYTTMSLGSGFGSIISLASFNRFNTNIMRQSWYITLGQLAVFVIFIIITNSISHHFLWLVAQEDEDAVSHTIMTDHLGLYFHAASAITSMELPHLWTVLFYSTLTLSAWLVMIIQLYSMLTSIFDEWEPLRIKKREFMFGFVGCLTICSAYFCTSDGVFFFQALLFDAKFTQTTLNLLLLLVILWVYGRERFQRDIEFMVGQPFSTWKVNVLRFVAPIFLLGVLMFTGTGVYYEHIYGTLVVLIAGIIMIGLPWLAIPIYAILTMYQTTGSFTARFKRCSRPRDWYPVEPDARQRYEETVGNLDLTHQLTVIDDQI